MMRSVPFLLSIVWLFCLIFSCGPDKNNPFGLAQNHIYYQLKTGGERDYKVNCSLEKISNTYKLSLKGSNNSDGIIITIKNIKSMTPQVLYFNKEVSLIVNEKINNELNIYVSSACKNNPGAFEIVNWDIDNNTITGFFSGAVCTRGVFAHLPSTEIQEGAFYKLKYNVK